MSRILTLDERRRKRGLTLQDVADNTGIKYSTVYVHHRKGRVPSLADANRYAEFYGCTELAILKAFRGNKS